MLARIPEKTIHLVRWGFAIGWVLLILSLFADPLSYHLTETGQLFAAAAPNHCFQFQGHCHVLSAYPMGARLFWGMVLPLIILTLLILGHETWRRICPLSFISQIPRALRLQRKTTIAEDSWLARHTLTFQFGLLFLGLTLRLLLFNSDRLLLGCLLLFTILAAITVGFFYDGKTWCQYFCPMAPVQMIYSEPSGLLGSRAHTAPPKSITQSMCRTVDQTGQEKSACVACKSPCIDIDAEGAYWEGIRQVDRKLLYYGYFGLVVGFYLYFWLYSGNWHFLSAGVWNETNQLRTLLSPGFFIAGHAIAIPKLIAVPFTLVISTSVGYVIGISAERAYKHYTRQQARPLPPETVQSRSFTIATFLSFNCLFFMGVRPTLGYFPSFVQDFVAGLAVILSTLWLVKSWNSSLQRYNRERDTNLLRRQLSKIDIDLSKFLEGRALEDLSPDELYTLAKVIPGFAQEYRWQIYSNVLREALEQRSVTPSSSLKAFDTLRQKFAISEESHWSILDLLQSEFPHLFRQHPIPEANVTLLRSRSQPPDPNLHRTVLRSNSRSTEALPPPAGADMTVLRPSDPPASPDTNAQTILRPINPKSPTSGSEPSDQA